MDRRIHDDSRLYNTDKVNDKIGLDDKHITSDRIDIFIDRLNKNKRWALVTHKIYENGKEVEKQYLPYIEIDKDLEELVYASFTKEVNVHLIDLSHVYFYVHDDKKEKGYVDLNYIEYNDGKPQRKSMRILKSVKKNIEKIIFDYRKNDSRINSSFDGYYRDPTDKPTRMSRRAIREQKEANSMPMPEPKVRFTMIENARELAEHIKNCALDRFGSKRSSNMTHGNETSYRHK